MYKIWTPLFSKSSSWQYIFYNIIYFLIKTVSYALKSYNHSRKSLLEYHLTCYGISTFLLLKLFAIKYWYQVHLVFKYWLNNCEAKSKWRNRYLCVKYIEVWRRDQVCNWNYYNLYIIIILVQILMCLL